MRSDHFGVLSRMVTAPLLLLLGVWAAGPSAAHLAGALRPGLRDYPYWDLGGSPINFLAVVAAGTVLSWLICWFERLTSGTLRAHIRHCWMLYVALAVAIAIDLWHGYGGVLSNFRSQSPYWVLAPAIGANAVVLLAHARERVAV